MQRRRVTEDVHCCFAMRTPPATRPKQPSLQPRKIHPKILRRHVASLQPSSFVLSERLVGAMHPAKNSCSTSGNISPEKA